MLDPVAPLPRSYKPWATDGGCETHHVELLLPGFADHDDRHRAIRRTGRPQPRIAYPRHLRALPPRPLAVLLQVMALDLPPIGQCEGVGTLPFHKERPLVGRRNMTHELRIAEPTIRDDQRRRQLHAASVKSRHAPVYHDLHPAQFVTARRPRACGVGPTDGKVDGDDQLALADHHDQQYPINPGEHPMFLA